VQEGPAEGCPCTRDGLLWQGLQVRETAMALTSAPLSGLFAKQRKANITKRG
jgi:hypothetical protein